jgi:hypothetical protein
MGKLTDMGRVSEETKGISTGPELGGHNSG